MAALGLRRYVARRAAYTVGLLLIVIAFNFFLFQILPYVVSCGSTFKICFENFYLPEGVMRGNVTAYYDHLRQVISTAYGLDQPMYVRFGLYFIDMLTFQFGYHVGGTNGPVLTTIAIKTPFTLLLLGSATIAAFIIGIGIGVLAAAKRGKILDVSSLGVLLFLNSLPVFFLGSMLELVQVVTSNTFYKSYGAATFLKTGLPYYAGVLEALFLPFITLTIATIGGVFLTQRAVMIDTVAEDYVLMARAKGLPERTVLYKHAFRNAVLPIFTAFVLAIGFILSGAVITETVFNWPGLGLAIFQAIVQTDYPMEQAMFFIISIMVLIATFSADVLYGVLDPRVSSG